MLLVVGGRRSDIFSRQLSSTEVFEVGGSFQQWTILTNTPLPLPLWSLRAVSVDNKIYLTGDDSLDMINNINNLYLHVMLLRRMR